MAVPQKKVGYCLGYAPKMVATAAPPWRPKEPPASIPPTQMVATAAPPWPPKEPPAPIPPPESVATAAQPWRSAEHTVSNQARHKASPKF